MQNLADAAANSEQPKAFKRFIVFSFAAHLLLLVFLSMKSALFPDKPIEYLPSLRVDLVALPDQKKNEISRQFLISA